MLEIGNFAVPLLIFLIVAVAIVRRLPAFDLFTQGAAEGIRTTLHILPTLIGLVMAVQMLRASGALDNLAFLLRPVTDLFAIPAELVPLILLRPVSGSGSSAYVAALLQQFGADSEIGRMASVLSASTDTTFYAVSVYLGSVGIKKSGWIIPAALLGDLAAAVLTITAVRLFF